MARRLVGKAATGLSPAEAAPQVAGAFRRRMEARASRVVRTEVLHAYNQHSQDQIAELAAEDGRILKRWDATIDGRTCSECRALHGVAVRPNEDFPRGVYQPPLHPHCRCTTIVWREDWDRKKKDPATIELAGPPTGEE
jgi:SPP1 gp7 family putative phage head morphogenesis protein